MTDNTATALPALPESVQRLKAALEALEALAPINNMATDGELFRLFHRRIDAAAAFVHAASPEAIRALLDAASAVRASAGAVEVPALRVEHVHDECIEFYVGDTLVGEANHDDDGWSGMDRMQQLAKAVHAAMLAAAPSALTARPAPDTLGAPASPSGSPLQSPAATSAAIPSALIAQWAAHCSEQMHCAKRFNVSDDGRLIDDDDFLYDAMIRVGGDFGEGVRVSYTQLIADVLNIVDAAARGIEREARESEGPSPKGEEPGPAGTRPEAVARPAVALTDPLVRQMAEALQKAAAILSGENMTKRDLIGALEEAAAALRAYKERGIPSAPSAQQQAGGE